MQTMLNLISTGLCTEILKPSNIRLEKVYPSVWDYSKLILKPVDKCTK